MLGFAIDVEASMYRVIVYRGFEIHVRLALAFEGLYNATFQIKGGDNLGVIGEIGARRPLRNGPFSLRRAYLVAELAGQAAIDSVVD